MIRTTSDTTQRLHNGSRSSALRVLVAGALLAAAGSTAVAVAPAGASAPSPGTPNQCIARNGGDWTGCNVGNSGSGNLPYRTLVAAVYTPDRCIQNNGGDWNACNVGNSGNLPYLPVS